MEERENVQCKYCAMYIDREKRCKLDRCTKYEPDELHMCDSAPSLSGMFGQLKAAGDAAAEAARTLAVQLDRVMNSEDGKAMSEEARSMADRLLILSREAQASVARNWTVPEDLGTCADCARLRKSHAEWAFGSRVMGECRYAPPAFHGFVLSDWRGCAKWERKKGE